MPTVIGQDEFGDALLLDLYELTMVQAYLEHGMTAPASFEFFVRRLPRDRSFLLAAGLEQALDLLEAFRFSEAELDYLAGSGQVSRAFVDQLAGLRFSGEVWAMPEGTVFFANEPILRVTAPLPEAQLVETRLINLLHFQTLIASKAARAVLAAQGRKLIDFGLRRAHGAEAGVLAARAAYIAGFDGTSNVQAGARFALPTYGTMAHSFVQAHEDEADAFERFAVTHPNDVVLLIDTYDTEAAAQKVVALSSRLRGRGIAIKAVRIDSGDLGAHARNVRAILDAGGLRDVSIVASSGLDERGIDLLVRSGAPIDMFAPGTRIVTSADAPFLDCAYKLVEFAGRPCFKRSEGKVTYPGRKQVSRRLDAGGHIVGDHLHLEDERGEGVPLLERVMQGGRRLARSPKLEDVRRRAAKSIASLPAPLRALDPASPPPLAISSRFDLLMHHSHTGGGESLHGGSEGGRIRDLGGAPPRGETDGGATAEAAARGPAVRFVEHTGEIELQLRAPTLAGLFVEAGKILADLMLRDVTSPERGPETAHAVVTVDARDHAGLLVAWIDELIYRAETEKAVFTRFEIRSISERALSAAIHGVSPTVFRNPVKAATYHRLRLEQEAAGSFVANVILDV